MSPYRCAGIEVPRPPAWWRAWLNRWWLDAAFGRFQWWRRLRGGHWEHWLIDWPVLSDMWLPNEHGTRPGLGVGQPSACEDWS